jgi:hypothetical protein
MVWRSFMDDGHIWFELFIIVLLVLGNAVCSLAEIAIVGARKTKLQELAYGALGIFPPLPAYLFGDIDIVDKGHDNKAEPTLYPEQEGKIEDQHDSELGPLHLHIEFLFLFVDH